VNICVVLGGIVNAGWSTAYSWTVRVPRKVRRLRHNPRNWPHVVDEDSLGKKCGFLLLARQGSLAVLTTNPMLGEVGLPRKARRGA